jgi:uncharacterized membrane protein YkoI
MKPAVISSLLAGLAAGAVFALPAHADDDTQEMEALVKQFGFITLEQASAKALAAKPGVVTDADLDDRDFGKGWDYEFEIADADGHEWEVYVDAKTGEVRKVSREWF